MNNPYLEYFIAALIIIFALLYACNTIWYRVKVEKELVNIISDQLTIREYILMTDDELRDFILNNSKSMLPHDWTIATYPFIQDSLQGRNNYLKRFRGLLEINLKVK